MHSSRAMQQYPWARAGGLENWHHTGNATLRQKSNSSTQGSSMADSQDKGSIATEFELFCIDIFKHL